MRPKVQEAPGEVVRMRARRGGGGVLASLVLVLVPVLLQGQQGERDHAAGQRGELSLAALVIVLPGLEGRDGIWRMEDK